MNAPGCAIGVGRRIRVRAVLVAAVVVAIAGLAAESAAVAASRATAPSYPGAASLRAVSCRGSTWCMAVGTYIDPSHRYHSLAQTWDKGVWRVLEAPPGQILWEVSCTSRWFCLADSELPTGQQTGIERWNGKTWVRMASQPGGYLGSLSCGDQRLCMGITGLDVQTWFGQKWRDQVATNVCDVPGQECGLNDLSCGNATTCLAVGETTIDQAGDQIPKAVFWDGTGFSSYPSPPADYDPSADGVVSCAGSFCMVGGGGYSDVAGGDLPMAATFTAKGVWTDITSTLDLPAVCGGYCWVNPPMSCGSSANCMALDGASHLWWNGTGWQSKPSVSAGRGSGLDAVGCSGSMCMAVGNRTIHGVIRTLAELWNGKTWTILPTPKVT